MTTSKITHFRNAFGCHVYRQRLFDFKWGATLLFMLLTFSVFSQDCVILDCSAISMRITPKYEENIDVDCSVTPECGFTDPFRHFVYRVDLYYVPSSGPFTPFKLDYKEVISGVKFTVSNPTTDYFSRINWKATVRCNMEATDIWENESFSFDEGLQKILMGFEDYSTELCDGDDILFESYYNGSGTIGRAHLFDVVIDAYPGETINLECDQFQYRADNHTFCNMTPATLAEEAASCVPYTPITVDFPDPSSGINNDIQVAIEAPSVDMNGDVTFEIVVKNLNPFTSRVITYLEFSALLATDQVLMDPTIVSSNLSVLKMTDNTDRIYRFFSDFSSPLTVAALTTTSLATLTITGPIPDNLCWDVTFSTPDNSTSRLRTTQGGCSSLNVSSQEQIYEETDCLNPCGEDVDKYLAFEIVAEPDMSGCGVNVKLGLISLNPGIKDMTLDKFKFLITLDKSASMAVANIDYGPFTACTSCSFVNNDPSLQLNFEFSPSIFVDLTTGAYMTFHLDGMGCFSGFSVQEVGVQLSGVVECMPLIQPFSGSVCTPSLTGVLLTEQSEGIEDATVAIESNNLACSLVENLSDANGFWGSCDPCSLASDFEVTPTLELDPLNGVNTWDLVLISRHILNLEPLPTPYKLIAADANKSGTITTFDIVEIRKLILGTYSVYPNNTSWRFFDASKTFTNPANPFGNTIEDWDKIENIPLYTTDINFIGVKIGDVDNSAVPNHRPQILNNIPVSWEIPTAGKNQNFITVPVIYQGNPSLEAIQLSLHFDPAAVELVTPSEGNIPGFEEASFGLKEISAGIINALWFYNPAVNESRMQQGDIMFYLTFKIIKQLPEDGSWLQMDHSGVESVAWSTAGSMFNVMPEANEAQRRENSTSVGGKERVTVRISPNPVSDKLNFIVQSSEEQNAGIGIFGPFGNLIIEKTVQLSRGKQQLEIPEIASLPSGVYNWRLWNTDFKTSGTLIKQ